MDAIETDITTLTAHILSQQQHFKEATGDFSILINAIATACKWITNVVRKAELLHVIGNTGVHNVQQESVQKLDILSNNIMINMLKGSGKTCLLVSEELERELCDGHGHYCVVFDPLDGSSNIDCGVAVGTIFGIYRVDRSLDLLPQIMCSGSNMIASGYCMYGSCSILVLALGGHVNGYTLDPDIGEFLLTHRKVDFLTQIKLGTKKIYSLNEGYSHSFDPAIAAYLDTLKNPAPGQTDFKPYSARYVGSMVADVFFVNVDASHIIVRWSVLVSRWKTAPALRMLSNGHDYRSSWW
jgi:fructose-1,6-bisphosphatase I